MSKRNRAFQIYFEGAKRRVGWREAARGAKPAGIPEEIGGRGAVPKRTDSCVPNSL